MTGLLDDMLTEERRGGYISRRVIWPAKVEAWILIADEGYDGIELIGVFSTEDKAEIRQWELELRAKLWSDANVDRWRADRGMPPADRPLIPHYAGPRTHPPQQYLIEKVVLDD